MTPLLALAISGIGFVILFVLTLINFARMGMHVTSFDDDFEGKFKSFGRGMASHVILGGLASLFFMATVGSAIWLAVVKLG